MASEALPAGLSAAMASAWGVRERPARGPKPAMTLAAIVEAGIRIAVADGLPGVSMGRVAAEVGLSTMALYRYVDAKDGLLELMVDTALGTPPDPEPGETWRAGLRRWGVGVRDAYRRNPWALRVPISTPPLGPNNMRWLENALGALTGTGLRPQQRLSSVLLVSGFVRSEETLLHDMASGQRPGAPSDHYAVLLGALIDDVRFPQISAALASGALADAEGIDGEFDFGIERILDGIAALMPDRRARRRAP